MIRAEAETCFVKNENKHSHVTLAFDDRKFSAHKGPNYPKHNVKKITPKSLDPKKL